MEKRLEKLVEIIKSKKITDLLILDLDGASSVFDYTVICTGLSSKNIQGLTDEIKREMGQDNVLCVEGYSEGKWVLIDLDDIVIHIFDKEYREYYNLEELWSESTEIYRS